MKDTIIFQGKGIIGITENSEGTLTMVDFIGDGGLLHTWSFHGQPFNFLHKEEKERIKNNICKI